MQGKRIAAIALSVAALLTVTGADSCGPEDLLDNASFDLWCGDSLCSWELERGAVEKVATWHASDAGVGLVGDPVVMSQLSRVDEEDVDCILFSLMAQTDDGTTVQLELDFNDDGLAEYEHPIPVMDWQTVSYDIRPPAWFEGIRFRIRKTGSGDAVLAQIRAQTDDAENCESMDPIGYEDLPDGSYCQQNTECANTHCESLPVLSSEEEDRWQGACGQCREEYGCSPGELCGVTYTAENLATPDCVDPASKVLGEACVQDEECATSVCCGGQCSECCSNAACDGTAICMRPTATDGDADPGILPLMCHPNLYLRAGGEPCLSGADCTSGECLATEPLMLCDPGGQPCASHSDCPLGDGEASCATLGAREGVCAEAEAEAKDTGLDTGADAGTPVAP